MKLFTSTRERWLWFWVGIILIAIYATLGHAPMLFEFLQDQDMVSNTFWLGLFLVFAAIVTQGLKNRPTGAEIVIALGVMAVYVLVFARLASQGERSHLIEYSIVAIFVYEALLERANNGAAVPRPALLAIAITTGLGIVDECIQMALPNRVFSPFDVFFDFVASVMAISGSLILAWGRGYVQKMMNSSTKNN